MQNVSSDSVLCCCAQVIPMPVLYGVFFYMGWSALGGMQVITFHLSIINIHRVACSSRQASRLGGRVSLCLTLCCVSFCLVVWCVCVCRRCVVFHFARWCGVSVSADAMLCFMLPGGVVCRCLTLCCVSCCLVVWSV